jgi:hypothetical protein
MQDIAQMRSPLTKLMMGDWVMKYDITNIRTVKHVEIVVIGTGKDLCMKLCRMHL